MGPDDRGMLVKPREGADAADADTMSGMQVFLEAYQTLSQARSPPSSTSSTAIARKF